MRPKNRNESKQSVKVLVAKYALIGVLITAIITLIAALLVFASNLFNTFVDYQRSLIPIKATQTAEAGLTQIAQLEKVYPTQAQPPTNTKTPIPETTTPSLPNTITPSLTPSSTPTPTFTHTPTFTPTNFSTVDFKTGCISADYWHLMESASSKQFKTDSNNCWQLDNWGIKAIKDIGLYFFGDNLPGNSLRAIYTVMPDITEIHVQIIINKLISADSKKLPFIVIGITGIDGLYDAGQFLIFYGFYQGSVYGNTSIFLSPGIGFNGEIKGEQAFGNPQDFYFLRDKRNVSIKWGSNSYSVLLPPTQKQQVFWIGFGAPGGGSIDVVIPEFSITK